MDSKAITGFLVLAALLFAAARCGNGNGEEDAAADGDGAADPQPEADASTDPLPDAPPDAPADADAAGDVVCEFGAAFVEQFDKGCGGESDCAVVALFVDCCQTPLAAGVNESETARFEAAWAACLEVLDHCRCPAGPPQAEDGESAESMESIVVDCQSGMCMTRVP